MKILLGVTIMNDGFSVNLTKSDLENIKSMYREYSSLVTCMAKNGASDSIIDHILGIEMGMDKILAVIGLDKKLLDI